jgi:Zn-dependent protease with chaperone function
VSDAPALFYDGRSPRARPVRLRIADGHLVAEADEAEGLDERDAIASATNTADSADSADRADPVALPRRWPLDGLRWPERQRHGPRLMDLPDGSSLQARDPQAWDDLARQAGRHDSLVVRLQQSWRGTLVALLLVVAVVAGLQRWGVPALAAGVTGLLPASVDRTLGERTLVALDGQMFKPSRIDAAEQARLQAVMDEVLARHPDFRSDKVATDATPATSAPPARLLLRDTGRMANAWALPDGSIVLSDEMVRLIAQDTDAAEQRALLIGLFGHELAHVTHRHGLKMLVQVSLTSALGTLVFGDLSGLLASAPLLLGQLAWSREAEREADVAALERLRAHGLDGEPMARLLERLHAGSTASGEDPGLLSSHPDHVERIAWFRQAR